MRAKSAVYCAVSCLLWVGSVGANTLKDDPPTIFYPEGHYLAGWPRSARRDMFGYNYQRHAFSGSIANVYLGGDGWPPYRGRDDAYYAALVDYGFADSEGEAEGMMEALPYWELRKVHVNMHWNDVWLSNQDRGDDAMGAVPDGNLDRHYGFPTYYDSGAELTEVQAVPVEVERRGHTKTMYAYYYYKLVAVPSSAVLLDEVWYTAEGAEMGPAYYGAFAMVEYEAYNPLEEGRRHSRGISPRQGCALISPQGRGCRGPRR